MMLSGNFFYIKTLIQTTDKIEALIEINAQHEIFIGHFPNQPVVPGVCMMQIIKEIFESALAKKTNLINADQLKFLAVLDPSKNIIVHAQIKYAIENNNQIKVAASLFNESIIYFKMNAVFVFQETQNKSNSLFIPNSE